MTGIAVLGYGVVGSGVVELLKKSNRIISKKAEEEIKVKYILDIREFPDSPEKSMIIKDINQILNDSEIKIVVETIGGAGVAYEYTKNALLSGKHVVTSNKELVATHGKELLKLAKENNLNYLYEASVGGGIPIIKPLHECLSANEITSITGILNGTTNYILTCMENEGKDFETALKDAQKNGFAEVNPSDDINGHDTCRKLAILSSIAFERFVDYKNIPTKGIADLTYEDLKKAQDNGYKIKLVAHSEKVDDKILAFVCPVMIKPSHILAGVNGVFNAVLVNGDSVGDVMFYGRGAGKLPTASAVVGDIIDICKNINTSFITTWDKGQTLEEVEYMQRQDLIYKAITQFTII